MKEMYKFLENKKVPLDYIITENGTFGYNPVNKKITEIFNKFWAFYMKSPTYRDQPLWGFICLKENIKRVLIDNFKNRNDKTNNKLLFLETGYNSLNPIHTYI